MALSQFRICRDPSPLKSGGNYMKDAECAEQNGKNYLKNSDFFSSMKLWQNFDEDWGHA